MAINRFEIGDYGSRREATKINTLHSLGLVVEGRYGTPGEEITVLITDYHNGTPRTQTIGARTVFLTMHPETPQEQQVTAFVPPRRVIRQLTGGGI